MFLKEQIKKRIKNEKGLTLIELLAVIVILAIIAAIAIPAIGNIINNSRDKAVLSDISGMVSAAKIAYADGACGSDSSCAYSSTAASSEIAFTTTKFSTGAVAFDTTGAITGITVTIPTDTFKGKKAAELKTMTDASFTEETLNTKMGK